MSSTSVSEPPAVQAEEYRPRLIELTSDQRVLLQRDLQRTSIAQKLFDGGVGQITYDRDQYPFARIIAEMLIEKGLVNRLIDLENLHLHLDPADMSVDEHQINRVIKSFYDTNDKFISTYRRFIRDVIADRVIGEDVYFQEIPTIRFHFPFAAGMDRIERFHSDIMLGHPPQEINVWLPLTDAKRAQNFVLTSLKASMAMMAQFDFDPNRFGAAIYEDAELLSHLRSAAQPVDIEYGRATIFDSRCIHAALLNQSDVTRISFDIRVIPVSDYQTVPFEFRGTGRTKARFIPGHYYNVRSIRHLSASFLA
ncbi:MAG: phytanoyl-CoA dioxygenase family protein [Alphaproteobacteria bacterium]